MRLLGCCDLKLILNGYAETYPYYDAVLKKFNGNQSEWYTEADHRLRSWGFNTIAGWTWEPQTYFPDWPFTPIVDFGQLQEQVP